MGAGAGPITVSDGLVLALDAASSRSTSKSNQKFNLLEDPGNWAVGTSSSSGYSRNGGVDEQSRVYVTDDPWGQSSVTWKTTPDSTSGADGGWNTSFYACDRTKTHRMSIWVRRYTTGTGGTFYFGLHFSPTNTPQRVDNGSLQGNPYFVHDAISDLSHNVWYLVVHHVHPYGYNRAKGDHPDSGWYRDGIKVSSLNVGNTGGDVVFLANTTSIRHRTYHYYTTNTSSGLEFADPKIDIITPKTPKVKHLLKNSASGWKDIKTKTNYNIPVSLQFTGYNKQSCFSFDGTDDNVIFPAINLGSDPVFSIDMVIRRTSSFSNGGYWGLGGGGSGNGINGYVSRSNKIGWDLWGLTTFDTSQDYPLNEWVHVCWVKVATGFTTSSLKIYINGVEFSLNYTVRNNSSTVNIVDGLAIGRISDNVNSYYAPGDIAITKLYNLALSPDEVIQNFNAIKSRFNL